MINSRNVTRNNLPFSEKYRPRKLEDLILDNIILLHIINGSLCEILMFGSLSTLNVVSLMNLIYDS
jgi:hypothetical protein